MLPNRQERRDGVIYLGNMYRSTPLLLVAFLAMSALRLPCVSGQMTIPQGIEAVYDNKSGGTRGSKRNVFRKSRGSSSSSWSKKKKKPHSSSSSRSSRSSRKSKSKSSDKSSKSKSKSSDKLSKSYTKRKRSGGSKHKDSSSSKSKSVTTTDSSKSKKKSGGSKHKDSDSKTRGNNRTKKSYSRDKKSNNDKDKDKDEDEDEDNDNDKDKKKTSKTIDKKSTSEGKPKVSTWQYITATSGDSGFDENTNDFDILRDLITTADFVELLSDPDDGGLDVITFFAPWDLAFSKLADRLGYDGDYDGKWYHEEKEWVIRYVSNQVCFVYLFCRPQINVEC